MGPLGKNKKLKVLLIDDDIFFRKLYRDKMTRAGYLFIEAINGIEGLHKVISDEPDLVLLDLMLPRKNGFDVLKEIKTNTTTKHIPVIILSSLGQESDLKEGMALGAEDYFVKGEVCLSDVVEKVNYILSKKK
ncbi:MAG: response regulator [Patescibacteria group bacterium]